MKIFRFLRLLFSESGKKEVSGMEKIMGKILTGALIVALTSTIFNSEVKADISEQTVPAVGVVADSKKTEELK